MNEYQSLSVFDYRFWYREVEHLWEGSLFVCFDTCPAYMFGIWPFHILFVLYVFLMNPYSSYQILVFSYIFLFVLAFFLVCSVSSIFGCPVTKDFSPPHPHLSRTQAPCPLPPKKRKEGACLHVWCMPVSYKILSTSEFYIPKGFQDIMEHAMNDHMYLYIIYM